MTQNVNLSTYQSAIVNKFQSSDCNIMVNAVAGSGKTFTLMYLAEMWAIQNPTKKGIFVAFNKAIVEEIKTKLATKGITNLTAQTLHSFGFSVLRQNIKWTKLDGNAYADGFEEKVWQVSGMAMHPDYAQRCAVNADMDDDAFKRAFVRNCKHLYDLCRVELVQFGDIDKVGEIADHYRICEYANEVKVVSKILADAYNVRKSWTNGNVIDFTDMVVLANNYADTMPKYDLVFIDECQDLNMAQRKLALNAVAKGGKFVGVGDRCQAINGFCGANCNSFDLTLNYPMPNETIEMPLSINYRCGRNIVALAKNIVPQIEPHANAIDGVVEHIDAEKMHEIVAVGDMVLCRTNAPLIKEAYALMGKGIRAYVKGREFGTTLINFVKTKKVKRIDALMSKLDNHLEKVLSKEMEKHGWDATKTKEQSAKYQLEVDKTNCIKGLCDGNSKIANVNDLLNVLEMLFPRNEEKIDPKKVVTLCSCHKSKGLENDNVFILKSETLGVGKKWQLDWEVEQERNLQYVAYTRAKKALYLCPSEEK